ncbi:MAG: hypothetical protein C0524_15490 [Rhodobacter sp.]|nr:hypothetical protein [Rhodobacter sp.]
MLAGMTTRQRYACQAPSGVESAGTTQGSEMPDLQRHDCAVAFCCDRKFFHFALFMIRQIAFHNPVRRFDFVISTEDDLQVPDWALPFGIVLHRPAALPDVANHPNLDGKAAYLHRFFLAREFLGRYRRILYLDCDMFVEGGDLNRLFETDMGSHPVGMVLDSRYFLVAEFHAAEFRLAGLPAMPYANAGLKLIDTRAYCEQEVERRSFDAVKIAPEAIILADQSMLNLALKGQFAKLAPCWNWQLTDRLPLITARYPVFLRHFISVTKPDRDSSGKLDPRFNLAYREFLTNFIPELLPTLAPPCDVTPIGLKDLAKMALKHLGASRLIADFLADHPDPYRANL